MTVLELHNFLAPLDLDMEVIVRVANDDGEIVMGTVTNVEADAGCTEVEACMIEGDGKFELK